ncbi:hypothetical protein [Desulfovibrio inopinatus]|uniref:hypothetical protein n=1 Tax=Desulfovibrio inopinatus TaxID=102109 RepID=UPI00040B9BCC|nr:hypothetical protein [Desulfovibrio inopinatus]
MEQFDSGGTAPSPERSHKNRYVARAKISEESFRRIVSLFALDIEAGKIAESTGFSRNTINTYLRRIRVRIARYCLEQAPIFKKLSHGSAFFIIGRTLGGGRYYKKGPGLLYGILRADRTLFVEIMPDCERSTLTAVLSGSMYAQGQINLGYWKSFETPLTPGGLEDLFLRPSTSNVLQRIVSPEATLAAFLDFCRVRLEKFRGLRSETIRLHMKECEFRFNNNGKNIYTLTMQILEKDPLN